MASEQQLVITLGRFPCLSRERQRNLFSPVLQRVIRKSFSLVFGENQCKLAPLSVVVFRFSVLYAMTLRFVSKSTFAPEEIAASSQLEPALESLLRLMKVNDSVITSMRVIEILDRALFADLAQDEDKMRKCAAAFGIDQSDQADFPHQREMAKLLGAWRQARTQREVKLTVDATAKSHGEPVSMLAMDWNSLMIQFKAKFGVDRICQRKATSRSSKSVWQKGISRPSG